MAVAPEDRDQQDVAPQTQGSPSPVNSGGGGDSPPKGPKAPMPGAEPAPAVEITDQMEREINEALAKAADPAAPAPSGKTPAIRGPRVVQAGREHRTGRVVSVGPEDLFVEFGPKELGVASRNQWKPEETPAVGSSLELVVDRFDANEQIFVCSRPGAVQKADWEMLEPGQIVEARVTGSNKGGLELEIANHRAFMPASLVDVRRVDDLSVFVGEKVRCLVKRVDRSGAGNILLSRRDVVAQEMKVR
ncbi:MAG: S1 RNA-binding domain-containing protein [Planctomycetota bacterium]|nr:S1 RNA-binding domain-containing protein [Planctomycetota bacterium]